MSGGHGRLLGLGGLSLLTLLVLGWRPAWGGVTLAWDYTQGGTLATGFYVYRAPTCTGAFVKVTPTPLPLTPRLYTDTTVVEGESYCWQVTAVSAAGGESAASNALSFLVPALPLAPVHLRMVDPANPSP